jgi:hypothetical protein
VNTYKVCFTSIYDETKCSKEITASGKPVAPTAPVGVTISQDKSQGNAHDPTARIGAIITARWRNTDIPGQFITLEREGRVPLPLSTVDREGRVQTNQPSSKLAWIEIKRINSSYVPCPPARCPEHDEQGSTTELTVDTTPEGLQLRIEWGNSYRVCAIVPALGAAGKVCSAVVSPLPSVDVVRPIDPKRINRDVLTPKKPE